MVKGGAGSEFKEAFQFMDFDKDGVLNKNDLRRTFDEVGRVATDAELDKMLGEVSGPMGFTNFLNLFQSKMQGGAADDNETIEKAFRAFDNGKGKIDGERFKRSLMLWGDKFSQQEINDAFDHFNVDDKGFIDIEALVNMLTGKGDEETEE